MQRQQILEMAREVGLVSTYSKYDDWIEAGPSGQELEDFAKLVAAKEREACAKVIEQYPEWIGKKAKEDICIAIRARNKHD